MHINEIEGNIAGLEAKKKDLIAQIEAHEKELETLRINLKLRQGVL